MAKKGTEVAGQACTVTEGPNKGKTGKYTVDEDGNVWCEGDWGGTECGETKCGDSAAQVSIFESVTADGQVVYEIEGLIEVEGVGIFDSRVTIDAATQTSRKVVAIPIAATPLATLRESESEVERIMADVIGSHVEEGKGSQSY
jgi:hypothetical protein